MTKKTRLIRGKLVSVTSQRVQYKPYGYELSFPDLWVELEIPADTVVDVVLSSGSSGDDVYVAVNLDGLKAILKQTADAVDELDREYKQSLQ